MKDNDLLYVARCIFVLSCVRLRKNQIELKIMARKISRNWEKEETKRLIELYEARSDLWNPSRPNYQNR